MSINYKSLKIERKELIGLLLFFFFVLVFLPLAAQEKLTVDGDLTIKSADSGPPRYGLVLKPQNATPSAQEGRLYYNDTDNQAYYNYNGTDTGWKSLSPGDKYVATRIVAASNSLDTTCSPGVCSNPRADYTCDGIADQVEIQDAIDALGANPGAVYLLEGTYNISGQILLDSGTIKDSGKALIGTGRGTVLRRVSAISGYVITASSVNKILISQLMISDANTTGITNRGINFSSVTYSKIDKVWVESIGGPGIYIVSSSNNTISNNNVQNNSSYGIYLSNSGNNVIFHNNVQGNTNEGIYLTSSFNNIISNNNVQRSSSGKVGIYLSSSNNNTISSNNVQGNSNSEDGIYVSGSNNNTISNNNLQNNGRTGIYLLSSSNNTISSNNVQGNTRQGIYLSSSSNNTITANVVKDNGSEYGYYCGIVLDGSSSNIISSNRVSDTDGLGYGIDILNDTCDKNYLIGNLIDEAGYEKPIQDLGTGTKYTDKAKMTLERVVVAPTDGNPLDVSTSPQGYIALNPSGAVTLNSTTAISDGKTIGDILIFEGTSDTNTVNIPNGANTVVPTVLDLTKCPSQTSGKCLGLDDVLSLIWNGNDWVETGWSGN